MPNARIGEIVVSADPNEELVALGLGSCVGVVMTDTTVGVAGLAHVMLPESGQETAPAGKYADLAIPELLARVTAFGAARTRLRVAIVGGAAMFGTGGTLDIGSRNQAAVKDALSLAGLRCHAAQTGGEKGRTVRVRVASGATFVREAGGATTPLLTQQFQRLA